MLKYAKVVYDDRLSLSINAKNNNLSDAEMRYYIRSRGIDRRNASRLPYIEKISRYLKENPSANRKEAAKALGFGINTIRKYWDVAKGNKATEENKEKAYIRLSREKRAIDFLDSLSLDFLKEYISKREDAIKESINTTHSKALILDFDMTLFDTRIGMEARKSKDWDKVYGLIPRYRLYDGWREVLNWCKENKVKVAIVSGAKKELIVRTIKHFNIDVDCVIGFQLYIQKPSPKLVNQALKRLGGVSRENVISIGDHLKDKQMSENSGVKFIGAVWDCEHPMHRDELNRGETISSPMEVIKLLKDMEIVEIDEGAK